MSTEQTRETLVSNATRMSEISTRLGLGELATTIVEDTQRRLDDARLRAAVVGEIKQGKSTLINALVGKTVVPTGVTPTTGATVVLRSGAPIGPFIELEGGHREPLDEQRFARLVRNPDDPESGLSGSLEYVLDSGALPTDLELVDTPGVNDISNLRAVVSRGELPRADILILVLDATQLLNRAELAFLRDAIAAVGGLEDSGASLLIAVNRIDLIAEREQPKLLEHLERELAKGGSEAPSEMAAHACPYEVFLTDARTSVRDPEADTVGVRGLKDLRHRLFQLVESRKETLPMRARASLLRFGALLGHNAAIAARALTREDEALQKELEVIERELKTHTVDLTAIRKDMAGARERLLAESSGRIAAFRKELEKNADKVIETASHRAMSSHLAFAIHDAYLAFAQQEAEQLRASLDDVTQKILQTHSEQVRRRLAHATMRLGFRGPTIYIEPPSALLEAGLVAIGVAGTAVMYFGNMFTGLVMAIAGPLATVVIREKSIRDARARVREQLPGALDAADEALVDQVRRVVDGQLGALDEHLQLANEKLAEQLSCVLHRAKQDLDGRDQEARVKVQTELRELELELAGIRDRLQSLGMA